MFDKHFTLEEKIGQICLVGHSEAQVTGHIMNMISNYHITGVLLTRESFYRPKEVYQLSNYLQRYAGVDSPIWLGIRDKNKALTEKGMTATLPEKIVANYNNRLYTKQLAEMNGDELRAVGLNFILAPNFDFAQSNRESFLNEFRTTSQHAIATVEGYHAASIETFTPLQSMLHNILTNQVADKSRVLLYAKKLLSTLRSILLSPEDMMNPLITSLLIDKLNYDGIIVADFSQGENDAEDILHALKQGAHMVILQDDPTAQLTVLNDMIATVKKDQLMEDDIDLALEKAIAWKSLQKMSIVEAFDRDAFQSRHHQYVMEKIVNAQIIN